ncbi:MAG: Fic family protein [Bacillota bacterium]|nr:Fic family protein [Bacillota bacterium]
MEKDFLDTVALAAEYKACSEQLQSFPWGSIEIREKNGLKYIYLHKRLGGMQRTEYVGEYSDELYGVLVANNQKAKQIKKKARSLRSKLNDRGHIPGVLTEKVKLNIDLAKRNLVDTIYKQAVLEGVAVTFMDTETIIEGGKVSGVSADDIQKVNNLKHAWQFILDEGVISSPSDYNVLCYINKLALEGFYFNAGSLRSVPVAIGGTKWRPELPVESLVKEELGEILSLSDIYERALNALLFVVRKQLFIDGNKRTSVIFANHILISNGAGIVVIPEDGVGEYKKLLIDYYESGDKGRILAFLYERCLTKI